MKLDRSMMIALVLVIIINICLIYSVVRLGRTNKITKEYLEMYRDKVSDLTIKYSILRFSDSLQHRSERNNEKIKLGNAPSSKALIFRVHSNDCNDCVRNSLLVLKKHHVDKLMPIVMYADYPNIKSFRSDFPDISYPVIIQNSLETDLPKVSKPYIFVYSPSSATATRYFYPNWRLMDAFEQYVNTL